MMHGTCMARATSCPCLGLLWQALAHVHDIRHKVLENPGKAKVGSAWLWVKIGCIPDIAGAIRSSAKKLKSKL
jgi:hypothetical protein